MIALTIIAASMGRANGLASLLGAFALAGTAFAILLAPQVVRMDMREDLAHLELLKTWPVKASAVVRGELLWPGVRRSPPWPGRCWRSRRPVRNDAHERQRGWRLGGGAALAIVAPALVFAQLTIHNIGGAAVSGVGAARQSACRAASTRWGSG